MRLREDSSTVVVMSGTLMTGWLSVKGLASTRCSREDGQTDRRTARGLGVRPGRVSRCACVSGARLTWLEGSRTPVLSTPPFGMLEGSSSAGPDRASKELTNPFVWARQRQGSARISCGPWVRVLGREKRRALSASRWRADGETGRWGGIRLGLRLPGWLLRCRRRLASSSAEEVVRQESGSAKTLTRVGSCKGFRQRKGRAAWY